MTSQTVIDFDAATAARELGMQRSADSANRAEEGWTFQALAMLTAYAQQSQAPFLIEHARLWSEANGLPSPPDARAYGAVVRMAASKRRIERVGYALAASSNGSAKPTWRACAPHKDTP